MSRSPTKKYHPEKLPLIEIAIRWIDVFSFMTYKDEVRELAQQYVMNNIGNNKIIHPSTAASLAIYCACRDLNVHFDHARLNSIHQIFLIGLKSKRGIASETIIKKGVIGWKLKHE